MSDTKKTKKQYVDDLELKEEISKSYNQNKLTDKAVKMFLLMINGATKKYSYEFEEDKEDCMQEAMEQILRKWKCFDMEKDKPFSYFATMIHYSFSGHFKKIQSKGFRGIEDNEVEIEGTDEE